MDYQQWRKKKERSDQIWTWIMIAAFVVAWPVGIILAILKGQDKLPVLGLPQNMGSWKELYESFVRENRTAAAAREAKKQQEKELEQRKKRAKRQARGGRPTMIFGIILAAVGLLSIPGQLPAAGLWSLLRALSGCMAVFGAGLALALFGYGRMRRGRWQARYEAMIKPTEQSWVSIHQLADTVGRPYRKVCADLQQMLESGYWPGAWIDYNHARLMFIPFDSDQAAQASAPDEEAPAQQTADEAAAILRQIRADNDLIDDEELSRKIDRIELLTGKIFVYLRQHPEREGELRTFLNYYLPQTLKTLESYARLEAQGIETQSVRQAKEQVSRILDQLADGYERQLDKLFSSDVMDITADIAVMEQMLRRDGLTQDGLVFEERKP